MKKTKKQDSKAANVSWHPAFISALKLELEAYKDALEFLPEFQLTTEPLRIDCVIIKKRKNVIIKKNIAAIFRTWNLLEYKSPDDYVSIGDFYKVYGYACFYTYLKKIPITDLTITFVENHYPEKLIEHLKNIRGFTVAETSAGIYNVVGDVLPIQIIDSRQLSAEDNLWLKNLNKGLDFSEGDVLFEVMDEHYKKTKSADIIIYAQVIMQANYEALQEVIKMNNAPPSLEKVFKEVGWTEKWKAEGEKQGEIRGEKRGEKRRELQIARNLIAEGVTLKLVQKTTGLSLDEIKKL